MVAMVAYNLNNHCNNSRVRNNMPADFEIIEKNICFQGFFRLERYRLRYRLFNGGWCHPVVREVFERGHAAAVLPYDPLRNEIIMIEQFRVGAMAVPGGPWLLEVVAGIIEESESTIDVVKRECLEEAGCAVTDLIPLYDYLVSPGGTTECIALFCGKVDATQVGGIHGVIEEGEDIKVHVITLEAALSLLKAGKINSANAIIALQWLALNRDYVRRQWLSENQHSM